MKQADQYRLEYKPTEISLMAKIRKFHKTFYNLWYFLHPPWDTGITPPELMSYIQSHAPGRALDLGCGTGTNAITLAKHDWNVIGVDFAYRAIKIARRKARQTGVKVNFYVDEVTNLQNIRGYFELILDIGCFHSIEREKRQAYIFNLERLLDRKGTFLLYAFLQTTSDDESSGIDEEEIKKFSEKFRLIDRKDGTERGVRPSTWLTYQNKIGI